MPITVNTPSGATINFPDGTSPEQIRAAMGGQVNMADVDRKRGAPAGIRAVVGDPGRSPEDRLATLKDFYPDARYLGNEMVFTDPDTGRLTAYNPAGLDLGDVTEHGRMLGEAVGGVAGGIAGAFGSTPTGWTAAPVMVPAGVGVGAAAGAGLWDAAMEKLYGRQDTRSLARRAVDAGVDVGLNMGGQVVGDAVGRGLRSTLHGAKGNPLDRLADFEQAGVPIEGAGAAIWGGKPGQAAQGVLGWMPGSAGRIGAAADETLTGFEDSLRGLESQLGEVRTPVGASQEIRGGAEWRGDRFRETLGRLENRVERAIPDDTPVPVDNAMQLYRELLEEQAQAPESTRYLGPALKTLEGLIQDSAAADGTIPFRALRSIRTDIRSRLDAGDLVSGYAGKEGSQMQKVDRAIKADLREGAAAVPGGAESFGREQAYIAAMREPKTGKLAVAEDVLKQNPDRLWNWVKSGSKEGVERLQNLRSILPKTAWDNTRASVLHQMGRATEGAQDATGELVSIERFVTNYNKMSPEAREVLFGGIGGLESELNRLTRVASSLKETAKQRNFSNTAQANFYSNLMGGGMIGGAVASPTHALAAYLTPKLFSRVMTSPRFIRWVSEGANITDPNALRRHVMRLGTLGLSEPDTRELVQGVSEALRLPTEPQPAQEEDPFGLAAQLNAL